MRKYQKKVKDIVLIQTVTGIRIENVRFYGIKNINCRRIGKF